MMKVLVVASHNHGRYSPFILEQVEDLKRLGVECFFFGIKGKGISGYLSNLPRFRSAISSYKPDLIHAHFGLSGVFANLQRCVPVITTYHGSDINNSKLLLLSRVAMTLSAFNIFVSKKNIVRSRVRHRYGWIPCGINLNTFVQIPRNRARNDLGWKSDERIVIFAGAFDNEVKNASLAHSAVKFLDGVRLLELKGLSREQVALRMNAADALLMTSLSEGSPQVIKEAMACGCPIVSVDVGDVSEMVTGVDGCFITTKEPRDIADALMRAFVFPGKTSGRERLVELRLSGEEVASRILSIYNQVLIGR